MEPAKENGMSSSLVICRSALLLVGVTACYTQRPLESSVPAPATRIIARVTDSGAVAIGGPVGPGALEVEGIVATADEAVWNVNLMRVDYRGGSSVVWNKELVAFPRNALSNVNEKRVSKSRSWMAAGLIAAGAFLASQMFGNFGASGDGPGGGENPPN
jgi:hypothetical protein